LESTDRVIRMCSRDWIDQLILQIDIRLSVEVYNFLVYVTLIIQ
jgi:hypothetical protein